MLPSPVSGTEGYAHEAEALIGRYENMGDVPINVEIVETALLAPSP